MLLACEPVCADEVTIRELLGGVNVGTMPEVAELFDVSPQTVQQGWRQGGMPGENGKWNIAEIAIWHIRRRLRHAESRRPGDPASGDAMSQLAYREQIAIVRLREIKLAKEAGTSIDRHQAQAETSTALSILRENLLSVPRSLLPYFPAGQAEELADEVKRQISHSLTATAEALVKRFANDGDEPTVPTESTTDGEEESSEPAPKPKRRKTNPASK